MIELFFLAVSWFWTLLLVSSVALNLINVSWFLREKYITKTKLYDLDLPSFCVVI